MGKLFLLGGFFVATPLLLIFSILFFAFLTYQHGPYTAITTTPAKQHLAYAALPAEYSQIEQEIGVKNSRTEALRDFFARYSSPLEDFAEYIVQKADEYNLDYRLIPAIAMQESTLCQKIPKNSYNCWGYGIYGSKITRFESYEQGIDAVSKTLAKYRDDHNLKTTEEIMSRYTPSSTGSWANGVNSFISQVQ